MFGEVERNVLKFLEESCGEYVSGSFIAKKLNVTRAAVSKAVANLRRKGFMIDSHPKRGYRLIFLDDLRETNCILRELKMKLKFTVNYLTSTSSTQDVAKSLAEHGAPEGTIVIAEEMSAGRGRLGRKWHATSGGLWMTIVLRPNVPPVKMQLISLLAGVAVAKALANLYGLKPKLKWPNDVLINDRKVCGILAEASIEADAINYILLGVGINVNNEIPEDLKNVAISVKEALGKTVPRALILRAFLVELDKLYAEFNRGNTRRIIEDWKKYASTIGKKVRAIYRDRAIEGLAVDVKNDGSLVLKLEDGSIAVINAGDIIHLR